MKLFGLIALTLLLAGTVACQNATLPMHLRDKKAVAKATAESTEGKIKGTWQLISSVSDGIASPEADDHGSVNGLSMQVLFDGKKMHTSSTFKGSETQVVAEDYVVQDNKLITKVGTQGIILQNDQLQLVTDEANVLKFKKVKELVAEVEEVEAEVPEVVMTVE